MFWITPPPPQKKKRTQLFWTMASICLYQTCILQLSHELHRHFTQIKIILLKNRQAFLSSQHLSLLWLFQHRQPCPLLPSTPASACPHTHAHPSTRWPRLQEALPPDTPPQTAVLKEVWLRKGTQQLCWLWPGPQPTSAPKTAVGVRKKATQQPLLQAKIKYHFIHQPHLLFELRRKQNTILKGLLQ